MGMVNPSVSLPPNLLSFLLDSENRNKYSDTVIYSLINNDCSQRPEFFAKMKDDEIAEYLDNMQKQNDRSLKIEYAKKCHVNSDGVPKKVTPDGNLYRTYLPGRKAIRAKTVDGVYLKLYDYYSSGKTDIQDYSIANIFKLAIDAEADKNGVNVKNYDVSKSNTLVKYQQDYNRFFKPPFTQLDIRNVNVNIIHKYIVEMLNDELREEGEKVLLSAFKNFKTILNLIFDYATDEEIINSNIVRSSRKLRPREFYSLLNCSKKPAYKKALPSKDGLDILEEVKKRIKNPRFGKIYTDGYMFITSYWTGVRIAELCALLKKDVNFETKIIHFHKQELRDRKTNKIVMKEGLKNEKDLIEDGKYVPMLEDTYFYLKELFEKQEKLGIKSEYVFCKLDGSEIKESQYRSFLKRICEKHNCQVTNNHAVRMGFNSYVLTPAGVDTATRAKILGHSPATNEKYYSFEKNDYIEDTRDKINAFNGQVATIGYTSEQQKTP